MNRGPLTLREVAEVDHSHVVHVELDQVSHPNRAGTEEERVQRRWDRRPDPILQVLDLRRGGRWPELIEVAGATAQEGGEGREACVEATDLCAPSSFLDCLCLLSRLDTVEKLAMGELTIRRIKGRRNVPRLQDLSRLALTMCDSANRGIV